MKPLQVLILGCGNSALGRQLFDAGYRDVTNSDYSEVCIDKQEAWHRTDGYKDIKWEVIDMTNMAHIKVTSINTCQTKKILLQYLYRFFKGVFFFCFGQLQ